MHAHALAEQPPTARRPVVIAPSAVVESWQSSNCMTVGSMYQKYLHGANSGTKAIKVVRNAPHTVPAMDIQPAIVRLSAVFMAPNVRVLPRCMRSVAS